MRVCDNCGGLQATEPGGEFIGGRICQCGAPSHEVSRLKAQVESLRREYDEYHEQQSRLLSDERTRHAALRDELKAQVEKLESDLQHVRVNNINLLSQVESLEKQCGAYRQRLEELLEVHEFIDNEDQHQTKRTKAVLESTTAGRDYKSHEEYAVLEKQVAHYEKALKELSVLGGGRSEGNFIAQHALKSNMR